MHQQTDGGERNRAIVVAAAALRILTDAFRRGSPKAPLSPSFFAAVGKWQHRGTLLTHFYFFFFLLLFLAPPSFSFSHLSLYPRFGKKEN